VFVPPPSLLHAVTQKSPHISVFTNDYELVGGRSSGHLTPTSTIYNFTRQSVALLMCVASSSYCLPLTPTWKNALL
jgi:hypothetical protein